MSPGRSATGLCIACLVAVLAVLAVALAGRAAAVPGNRGSKCTSKVLRAAVLSYTRAFNQGDSESLDALFAPEPEFEWYSAPAPGGRLRAAAKRRASLPAYFRARHAKHDHLRLTAFQFNGNSPRWGNFDFTMRRSTADFMGGESFPQGGKGAAVCDAAGVRFIVFTFGEPYRLH